MEEQIVQLQRQIDELRNLIQKNNFTSVIINDKQVQFKKPSIFPRDNTAIRTDITRSTGRIAIQDEYGTTRYIPYF
jgi:TolA-binding protein